MHGRSSRNEKPKEDAQRADEMVVVEMVASAKVEAEMAAVEKGAAGMEKEMAEATGLEQKVAPVGRK